MGSLNCRKWNIIPIINSSLKGFFTPQHLERAALIVWHLIAGGCCCLSIATCCPGPHYKTGLISSLRLPQQCPIMLYQEVFVFSWSHNTGIHWHNALFSLLWREMLVLLESHLCLGRRVSTSLRCGTGRDAKLWSKWYQGATKENLLSPLEQQAVFGADLAFMTSLWSI